MKIAIVNKYLYRKGGSEVCALGQAKLLREKGHEVVLMGMPPFADSLSDFPIYEVPPIDYEAELSFWEKAMAVGRLFYSPVAKRMMERLLRQEKPDIVHLHNIYHQISPSIIDALAPADVPVVMTLHDYSLTCPTYLHYREDAPCEMCDHGRCLNAVRFRCARGSVARSAVNAAEWYLHHRLLDIYGHIDRFICPSRFMLRHTRRLYPGLPLVYLGNFVDLDRHRPQPMDEAERAVYFGRLSPEKGVLTLLEAARVLSCEVRFIGTGPMEEMLRSRAKAWNLSNVEFLGYKSGPQLRDLVSQSRCVVVPSEWYENNPLSVLEAFALGRPVVGTRIGGIPELVKGRRGVCCPPGDAGELSAAIREVVRERAKAERMGRAARRYAEQNHSPDDHYGKLMRVYEDCM